MTDIANETTVAAFCRRLPIRCDRCHKDHLRAHRIPEAPHMNLCDDCVVDVKNEVHDGADDGKLTWLTLPR